VSHTPGPWIAGPIDKAGWVDIVRDIKDCNHPQWGYPFAACKHFDQEANARLIAAAPELLEALQILVEAAESMKGTYTFEQGKTPEHEDHYGHEKWAEVFLQETADAARAAIAKATGDQP
jgi:hypothetical protein